MRGEGQEIFGPYVLLERLALGGMAELFLAVPQEEPDAAPVVIKRILPELVAREDVVEMFLDEKRLTSLLVHPNVVRLEDAGEIDGVHFIALEYVDGASLRQVQKARARLDLPLDLACFIIAETCAGLAYAHRRRLTYSSQDLGLVHRDISPQNILLSSLGEVKIADFGVAKAGLRLSQTSPGQMKGKFSYMSPEQLGQHPIDHRSDIFSAGVVLYEATTGYGLVQAKGPRETAEAILARRIVPPERRVADYPAALARVVRRALEPDPAERYDDAETMRQDLLAIYDPAQGNAQALAALVRSCGDRGALSALTSDQLDLATASSPARVASRSAGLRRSQAARPPAPPPPTAEVQPHRSGAGEPGEEVLPTVDLFDDATVPELQPPGLAAPAPSPATWRRPLIWALVAAAVLLVTFLVAGRFLHR